MARYTGAKLRITRRLGDLPGLTSKKGNSNTRPGQHGANQKKLTQYAIRLEEKQKIRLKLSCQIAKLLEEHLKGIEQFFLRRLNQNVWE